MVEAAGTARSWPISKCHLVLQIKQRSIALQNNTSKHSDLTLLSAGLKYYISLLKNDSV